MPRTRTVPLLLATLTVLLLLPASLNAAETKSFDDKGFTWSVPDGWRFLELSTDEMSNAYVARAATGTQDAYVLASIRTVPNNDPAFLRELTEEVRQGLGNTLSSRTESRVAEGSLGGLKGTVIVLRGKNQSDVPVYVRVYSVQAGHRIQQMFITFVGGSEAKLAATADKARRGFKLLEGGGDEGADAELLKAGDGALPPSDGEEDDEGEASGAVTEGRTLSFPTHNLKWTLPEDSPFQWKDITTNEGKDSQTLVEAVAGIELPGADEAKEGEPKANICRVTLETFPQEAGWTPAGLVNHAGFQQNVEQNLFDKADYGRMKIVDELPIGNYKGAALQMVGTKERMVVYVRFYAAGLRGRGYLWRVILAGNGSVNDDFKQALVELMEGIEFVETLTWIRGPVGIREVVTHDQARGSGEGVEKKVRSLGFEAEKPKELFDIDFQTGGNIRLAWELRSEDKQSYLYFDVQSWSKQGLPRDYDEQMVRQREGEWKQVTTGSETIAKGREPFFKSKFGRGRGLGYEFTGFLGETPYLEQGFVVEYKKYVYWIRVQYGGEDAEKLFAKTFKALKKAVKFVS